MALFRREAHPLTHPERLESLLPNLPLFRGLSNRDIARILPDMEWFSLPGGWSLMEPGDPARNLYIVTAGSLGRLAPAAEGDRPRVSAQFSPGQVVGEIALLSDRERFTRVIALRDTELLRISAEAFMAIAAKYPRVMENLIMALVERLQNSLEGKRAPEDGPAVPGTLALVPTTGDAPCRDLAHGLADALIRAGKRVRLLDKSDSRIATDVLHRMEGDYDHVIYVADIEDALWSQLCTRQADRVLLVAGGEPPVPARIEAEDWLRRQASRVVELVLVHPFHAEHPRASGEWIERLKPDIHHHIRRGHSRDLDRLVRHLSGQATGLVLAGGGARGFAHLGVIKALQEAGVTFDMVGGTSMGGIVAAALAMGWDFQEMKARMHKSFVAANPLSDYILPRKAFIRGRRISNLLKTNFADMRIEDLWLNFYCVSSNLTRGKQAVHRTGPLWQALRASVSLPGVVLPVVSRGDILVDGAVMNNFPVSIMADMRRGPVIGVDLEDHDAFREHSTEAWREAEWGVLGEDLSGGPGIVGLLMRAGTVNSEMQSARARRRCDFLFEPPVEGFAIRDWQSFDKAVDLGYRHAAERLETMDLSALTPSIPA